MPNPNPRRASGRKTRTRPAQRWLAALVKVLFCLAVGAGLGLFGRFGFQWARTTPLFAIRAVAISAGPRVNAADVRKLCGIREGKNIFAFSLDEAVRQIEFHPWVLRAAVSRKLPDRVEIKIVEREPAALAALGSLYYVDQTGEVFKRVLPGESLDYPAVTGLTLDEVIHEPAAAGGQLRRALAVLNLARASRVLPERQISELHLDATFGITVVTAAEGVLIRLGEEDYPARWLRLERVLVQLGGDLGKVEAIDLNFSDQATVKLKSGYKVAMN